MTPAAALVAEAAVMMSSSVMAVVAALRAAVVARILVRPSRVAPAIAVQHVVEGIKPA